MQIFTSVSRGGNQGLRKRRGCKFIYITKPAFTHRKPSWLRGNGEEDSMQYTTDSNCKPRPYICETQRELVRLHADPRNSARTSTLIFFSLIFAEVNADSHSLTV